MSDFDSSLWLRRPWEGGPVVAEADPLQAEETEAQFYSLAVGGELLGELQLCSTATAKRAVARSEEVWHSWNRLGFRTRYQRIKSLLVQLELRSEAFCSVWELERQQTESEVKEELLCSIEWLDQHLERLASSLDEPLQLPGPTGEANQLNLGGRGVWLLLLDEPVTPARLLLSTLLPLFCGNSVLLCSPPETGFAWTRFAESVREAGLDLGLVQFLPGRKEFESALLAAPQLAGVICLGDDARQQQIAKVLAERTGALVAQVQVPGLVKASEWASERMLLRLLCEQTLTANLTAVGGNTELLSVGCGQEAAAGQVEI